LRFRPYDLLVVPRQKVAATVCIASIDGYQPKTYLCCPGLQVDREYFTLSATGVMRIKRGVQVRHPWGKESG
jgi:hypothetical protein